MFRFFPRKTDPASASWRPIRTSRSVVLPAPFGPTRPSLSPFASSRSTSANRRRPPWDFATPSRRTTPGPEAPLRKERRKARGAVGGASSIAPHPLDPQLPREHLLVHL